MREREAVEEQLDAEVLDELEAGGCFAHQGLAVVEVSLTFRDLLHLFDPVRVNLPVLRDAQEGARPARGATALLFRGAFQNCDLGGTLERRGLSREGDGGGQSGCAAANDDEVVFS